jgi:predicted amidohydrolase
MPPKSINVAAAQVLSGPDPVANGRAVQAMLRQAAERKCRIVLFPEGCLTGYPDRKHIRRIDVSAVARAERRIARLAGALGVAVLVGSVSETEGGIQNDVLIIDRKGQPLGRYAKTFRAGEPWYVAGTGPVVFRLAGVCATVIICHDLRYPNLVRLAVAAGAQIVFIANNESGIDAENKLLGYRSMQIARATENDVYAVMANAPADPTDITRAGCSHGNSKIVDPLGNVLDEAGVFEQRLVTATLDLTRARRKPVRRALGQAADSQRLYGTACEHPAYAQWMRDGLKLVRRIGS